eukprot:symbB.v1.2.003951.t1/scaffold212.1/size265043/9
MVWCGILSNIGLVMMLWRWVVILYGVFRRDVSFGPEIISEVLSLDEVFAQPAESPEAWENGKGFGTSCNGLYSHDCVDSLKFFDQEARRHRL